MDEAGVQACLLLLARAADRQQIEKTLFRAMEAVYVAEERRAGQSAREPMVRERERARACERESNMGVERASGSRR
jgi:hypothetical protein